MSRSIIAVITIAFLFSCASDNQDASIQTSTDSSAVEIAEEIPHAVASTIHTEEEKDRFDTVPDYDTFEEYLMLFKPHALPVTYDSIYVRSIEGNNSSRLRFSRFFRLSDLKEPEELNAFYARDKFDLGNGRIGVTIMTDVAPEFVGPDGELKTVNFIVYDKNGKILSEKSLFQFYNVFNQMELSWGELDKDLMVYKYYYNATEDDRGDETVDRGNEMQPLNSLK